VHPSQLPHHLEAYKFLTSTICEAARSGQHLHSRPAAGTILAGWEWGMLARRLWQDCSRLCDVGWAVAASSAIRKAAIKKAA
jgi:hypothetical protein